MVVWVFEGIGFSGVRCFWFKSHPRSRASSCAARDSSRLVGGRLHLRGNARDAFRSRQWCVQWIGGDMRPCEAVPNVLGVGLGVFAGGVPCQEDRWRDLPNLRSPGRAQDAFH